jgi:Mg2+ and Co2+ transporter CorA
VIHARLYDADGRDREIDVEPGIADRVKDRQLLWIDVEGRDPADLETLTSAVGIGKHLAGRLARERGRADLTQYENHIHLVLETMEAAGSSHERAAGSEDDRVAASDEDDAEPVRRELDLVAGHNWVVTVHDGARPVLDRIADLTRGDTHFGALDAAGFLAAIVDEVLAGYLELAEGIEREIDRLDERALRSKPRDDVLARIVKLRRRIGTIRRTLTPHRLAFAALARPEMELHEELGHPWPGLSDRLDRAIEAIENLRDLLLGTYDIHMGRAAHEANEVMKRLTLLSAVLLPAVVLAGVMGMNFKVDFFENSANFWIVVGAMAVFGVSLLGAARWRGWL